jgi:hypothetical protein
LLRLSLRLNGSQRVSASGGRLRLYRRGASVVHFRENELQGIQLAPNSTSIAIRNADLSLRAIALRQGEAIFHPWQTRSGTLHRISG